MSSACPKPGEHRRRLRSRRCRAARSAAASNSAALSSMLTGGPQVAAESLVAPRRAARRNAVAEGFASELRGPLVAGRPARELGRLPEPVDRDSRPRPIRRPNPTARARARDGAGRPPAPPSRAASAASSSATNAAVLIACPVEMKGQFAGSIGARQNVRRLVGERVGNAPVQPLALRWKQLVVDDLADQRVTKPVGIGVAVNDNELRVDRGAQRNFEAVSVHFGDSDEEFVGGVAPDNGDDAEDRSARCSRPSRSEAMRSDRTAGIACPLRCAATSSAVKKGLP